MHVVTHMLAGAAIAKVARRPWLALPAAFASHLALDFAWHIDCRALFVRAYSGPAGSWTAVAALEVLIALSIPVAAWLIWRQPGRWLLLGGAFCGYLMDLMTTLDRASPWGPFLYRWSVSGWIDAVHHSPLHHGNPKYFAWPLGVVTELVVLVAVVGVLAWRRQGTDERHAGGAEYEGLPEVSSLQTETQ